GGRLRTTLFFCGPQDELRAFSADPDTFRKTLEHEVAPRIIERIFPDRGLDVVRARRKDGDERPSIELHMGGNLICEVGLDGKLKPPSSYTTGIFAPHGDWENFMPATVRFALRWPGINEKVRAVLSQALQKLVDYWVGQFQLRSTAGARCAPGLPS